VTLRGTVGSFREKREAGKAAARVCRVTEVSNKPQMRMLDRRRGDVDLRGDVLETLMLDSLVPLRVDAKVRDGVVTLTGTAQTGAVKGPCDWIAAVPVRHIDHRPGRRLRSGPAVGRRPAL
jgi:osmotically-inducible protein OsmY